MFIESMPKEFGEELHRAGSIDLYIPKPTEHVDQVLKTALEQATFKKGIVLMIGPDAALPVFCGMSLDTLKKLYQDTAALVLKAYKRTEKYQQMSANAKQHFKLFPNHYLVRLGTCPTRSGAVRQPIQNISYWANHMHTTQFSVIRGIPFFFYEGLRQEEALELWEKLYRLSYEYRKSPAYKQALKLANLWDKQRQAENALTKEQIATETFDATGHQEFFNNLQEKLEGPNKLALEVAIKWGCLMQYELKRGRRFNKTMIEESAERVARATDIPQPKIQTLNTAFEILASIWSHGGKMVSFYKTAPTLSVMRLAADNISRWRRVTLDKRLMDKSKER